MLRSPRRPLPQRARVAWLALGLFAACAGAATQALADSFTPEQRAEIVAILRDALKRDPSILRDAAEALQADETARQQQAAKAAIAARRSTLVTPADPSGGNPSGDVTVVEFFDIRCPYCRRLDPTVAALLARDHGVRLVYKDLPILGPASVLGARALIAAQRQDHYEALRAALMHDTAPPTAESIRAAAIRVGIDPDRLARDMDDPAVASRIEANLQLAKDLGINGTPALVIGTALIPGAIDLADLRSAVAQARQTN